MDTDPLDALDAQLATARRKHAAAVTALFPGRIFTCSPDGTITAWDLAGGHASPSYDPLARAYVKVTAPSRERYVTYAAAQAGTSPAAAIAYALDQARISAADAHARVGHAVTRAQQAVEAVAVLDAAQKAHADAARG